MILSTGPTPSLSALHPSFALALSAQGHAQVWRDGSAVVTSADPLPPRMWVMVAASFDAASARLTLATAPVSGLVGGRPTCTSTTLLDASAGVNGVNGDGDSVNGDAGCGATVAAAMVNGAPCYHYNGKVAGPSMYVHSFRDGANKSMKLCALHARPTDPKLRL